jgi:hypothetical protein
LQECHQCNPGKPNNQLTGTPTNYVNYVVDPTSNGNGAQVYVGRRSNIITSQLCYCPTFTSVPTNTPTKAPTSAPTRTPTHNPTVGPINDPTLAPTNTPTTNAPTESPAQTPTQSPTNTPTEEPTFK